MSDVSHKEPEQNGTDSLSLATLLVIDLVESTALVERLGDTRSSEVFALHDRLARDLLARYEGREIDKTDGFLLLFRRPAEALRYALEYHEGLARMSRQLGIELRARAGIHLGEVFLRHSSPEDVARGAKPLEVDGLAKPLAARLMGLAAGGQTLVTHSAFELARKTLDGAEDLPSDLEWLAHGEYELPAVGEPVEVYEVGRRGLAPLAAPPRRAVERHRRWWLPLAGVTALAALAALAFWVWSARPPLDPVRPSVAVLGFKNMSGHPEAARYAALLDDLLVEELAAGDRLRLISGERIARMKRELDLTALDSLAHDTLRAVRAVLGTDYVVLGSYLVLESDGGSTIRIQSVLQDAKSGDTLSTAGEHGSEQQLAELVARMGAELRARLDVETR